MCGCQPVWWRWGYPWLAGGDIVEEGGLLRVVRDY